MTEEMETIAPASADSAFEREFTPPKAWLADLVGYSWIRQSIGRSCAAVFRLESSRQPTLFVKVEPTGPFDEIPDEVARLRWLAARGIPCPRVLAQERSEQRDWLLMSAMHGRDLASSPDLRPEQIVEIVATALRRLHALDISACPFDQRLSNRIPLAQARIEAGVVDEDEFEDERLGRTPGDVLLELLARRPHDEDLVVTHGDACLPNLMADNGQFTAFVDCARAGVADRHQDLALASWSIGYNLGEEWIEPFLQRYGGEIDAARLKYYRLLDELF